MYNMWGAAPLGIKRPRGEGGHISPQDEGQGSDDTPPPPKGLPSIYKWGHPIYKYIYEYI